MIFLKLVKVAIIDDDTFFSCGLRRLIFECGLRNSILVHVSEITTTSKVYFDRDSYDLIFMSLVKCQNDRFIRDVFTTSNSKTIIIKKCINNINKISLSASFPIIYRNQSVSKTYALLKYLVTSKEKKKVKNLVSQYGCIELSLRETQTAIMLASGMRNKDIAVALKISSHTVSCHKMRMMRKMNIKKHSKLAQWFLEHEIP